MTRQQQGGAKSVHNCRFQQKNPKVKAKLRKSVLLGTLTGRVKKVKKVRKSGGMSNGTSKLSNGISNYWNAISTLSNGISKFSNGTMWGLSDAESLPDHSGVDHLLIASLVKP